ncbi:MAG: 50S ribosomal protein L4 [Victivallales bacterium]|nr:50S ribosomal protein L4 [Victivallales bacterium]
MPKKLNILDGNGAAAGEYAIEDHCLEFEKGAQAVHDVVVAYLAAQRAGTACTKTRAERRGGGAKPWRQKGLGRARSGSNRNPVWRKGGIIFGPKPRSYDKHVNKKVRALALKRAFTDRLCDDAVMVLSAFEPAEAKTKLAQQIFDNLKVEKTALLVVRDYDMDMDLATRNLANVLVIKADSVNVYMLLYFDKVIFTKDALDAFVQRLA